MYWGTNQFLFLERSFFKSAPFLFLLCLDVLGSTNGLGISFPDLSSALDILVNGVKSSSSTLFGVEMLLLLVFLLS